MRLCIVFAFALVLLRYDVSEKLYGVEWDNGPYSASTQEYGVDFQIHQFMVRGKPALILDDWWFQEVHQQHAGPRMSTMASTVRGR